MDSPASTTSVSPEAWTNDVLDFWFGELDDNGQAGDERSGRWWRKDPAFDQEIGERFGGLIAEAERGELEIGNEARERLAALIVLDQFSRNVGRDTAAMYALDDQALRLAASLVRRGEDKSLPAAMRSFCYLPFMHSESLDDQEYCIALFEVMKYEVPVSMRESVLRQIDFAHRHRDIVARFGRFPHRNELLGRPSTEEELTFLEQDGSSF